MSEPDGASRGGNGHHGRVAAVVVNPTKVQDDGAALRDTVSAALAGAGWSDVRWLETTAEDPGYGMAERALREGAGLVLACGGDGTVRAVLTVLAGSDAELGVVPLGTGNLLARNLGIPVDDLDAAAEVAVSGPVRVVDVGRVGPSAPGDRAERFAIMAGIGMDAAIMRDAPEAAKARIGWPAYVVSAARHLRGHGDRMRLELDGGAPRGLFAKTILVGNMGTLQAGLELMPDAEPDDGVLDVAVLSPRWAVDWLRIAARVIARRRRTDQRFACLPAKQIRVTTRHLQPRQVDGDLLESARELLIEVEPAALRVHTPPRSDD
jgi:YegS/Rv2252/BmrU family lipid kinase